MIMMSLLVSTATRKLSSHKTLRCHHALVSILECHVLWNNTNHDYDKNVFDSRRYISDRGKDQWMRRQEIWERNLDILQHHYKIQGHFVVDREVSGSLARWVDTQRTQYRLYQEGKKSTLNRDRIQSLNEIGFVWNVLDQKWEDKYKKLALYKQTYGHCNVPTTFTDETEYKESFTYRDDDELSLGRWVASQRKLYKKRYQQQQQSSAETDNELKNPLTEKRIAALNELGFIWDFQEALWYERLDELKKYKEQHGDCIVPRGYEANPVLAKWVDTQRQQRKYKDAGKKSNLTDDRIELLDKMNFVWNVHDYIWNKHYEELEFFLKMNGPITAETNKIARNKHPTLFRWIRAQKESYEKWENGEKSSMTTDRRTKLMQIGFHYLRV